MFSSSIRAKEKTGIRIYIIYEPRILYLAEHVITVRGADVSIVRVAREKRDRWSTNAVHVPK